MNTNTMSTNKISMFMREPSPTITDDRFKYKIYMTNKSNKLSLELIKKLKDNNVTKKKVSRFCNKYLFNMKGDKFQVDEDLRIWETWRLYEPFKNKEEVIVCSDGTNFIVDKSVFQKSEIFELPYYDSMYELLTVVYDIDIERNIWKELGNVRLVIEYIVMNDGKHKEKRRICSIPLSCYFVPCE